MSSTFKIGLITSIIGGLIVSFLLGYLNIIIDFIILISVTVFNLINLTVPIKIWILMIFGFVLLFCFFSIKNLKKAIKNNNNDTIDIFEVMDSLSQREKDLLRIFYDNQGSIIGIDNIPHRIGTNRLEVDQVMDLLIEKGLVKIKYNNYQGNIYRLTKHGRDLVLELF